MTAQQTQHLLDKALTALFGEQFIKRTEHGAIANEYSDVLANLNAKLAHPEPPSQTAKPVRSVSAERKQIVSKERSPRPEPKHSRSINGSSGRTPQRRARSTASLKT